MKCIQQTKTKQFSPPPTRVRDAVAFRIVIVERGGSYIPKHVFREYWADPEREGREREFAFIDTERQAAHRASLRAPRRKDW